MAISRALRRNSRRSLAASAARSIVSSSDGEPERKTAGRTRSACSEPTTQEAVKNAKETSSFGTANPSTTSTVYTIVATTYCVDRTRCAAHRNVTGVARPKVTNGKTAQIQLMTCVRVSIRAAMARIVRAWSASATDQPQMAWSMKALTASSGLLVKLGVTATVTWRRVSAVANE